MNVHNKPMIEKRAALWLHQAPLAKTTKKLYRHYLGDFLQWCFKNGRNIEEADQITVIDWFNDNPQWSQSTKHNALRSVKGFCEYEFGGDHPVMKAKTKRTDPGPQRCLDQDELLTLMSAINTKSIKGIRDLAIISLLADTGLRVAELCNIELKHLNMRKSELSVIIKGGDWAKAVFFDYTHSCLTAWLSVRGQVALETNRYLFSSIGGHTPGEQATPNMVRKMLEVLSQKADLDHLTPHALRRTFATLAIENGAPTRVVQVAGRWGSLRMVERYSRSLSAKAIKPFSVMNRLLNVTPQVEENTPGVLDSVVGLTEVAKLPENVETISEIDYRSKRAKKATNQEQILIERAVVYLARIEEGNQPTIIEATADNDVDPEQAAQNSEIWSDMLDTIAVLPLDEQGATYSMYIDIDAEGLSIK